MLIPRQLAPTVGLAHGGVEFLKGFLSGIEKLAIESDEKESARSDRVSYRTPHVEPTNFSELWLTGRAGLRRLPHDHNEI